MFDPLTDYAVTKEWPAKVTYKLMYRNLTEKILLLDPAISKNNKMTWLLLNHLPLDLNFPNPKTSNPTEFLTLLYH